jgi:hypothetical protein
MNLAYGFVAQTLQTHDELVAVRFNEQRRITADRRAERAERAERTQRTERTTHAQNRPNLAHRLNDRLHGRAHDLHGAGTVH